MSDEFPHRPIRGGRGSFFCWFLHHTPLDFAYPGVELHATIIEDILSRHFFARPLCKGFEFISVIALGILSTFCMARANAAVCCSLSVLGGSGIWYGSFLLLEKQGIFINPLLPVLMLSVNFSSLCLLRFYRSQKN